MDFKKEIVISCRMSNQNPLQSPAGAQTVDRACQLIKEIARAGTGGARILDLCTVTGLSRPTVHRILLALCAADFIHQNPKTKHYCLGTELFVLGLSAPSPIAALPEVTKLIDSLAQQTQDTAYLMLRSHDDAVCAWRGVGAFPITANIVVAGDRRPLAASVAGLCILAALPRADAQAIMESNRPYLPDYCRATTSQLQAHIESGQETGHIVGENLVMEGVTAVGIVVPTLSVQPYLGISISGIASRFTRQRMPELLALLKQTSQRIARIVDGAGARSVK